MDFLDVKDRIYPLLQDRIQTTWLNPIVAKAVTKAIRRVANRVGRDESLIKISLVESQQAYVLPLGVRRLSKVKIIPENGTEPPFRGLPQVLRHLIPLTTPNERDPVMFSLNLTGGAAQNQYELFFWPPPARSATDAIQITYALDTVIVSDDPSTTPQDEQVIPYAEQFEEAIIYYTAAFLLFERSDDKDTQEAQKFRLIADEEVRTNRPVDALSFYRDNNRAFP